MKKLFTTFALSALLMASAFAADLPVKAPLLAPLVATTLNAQTGWSGFYGGFGIYGTGTGVNFANLGSLTANSNSLEGDAGYEVYNGTYLLGARAGVGYDISTPGLASFSDHLNWHAGIVVGGNLAQITGLPVLQFPSFLASGIPYIAIEGCGHGKQTGECSSVGMEIVIPNTRWTAYGEYTNGQYNSAGLPGQTLSSSNGIRLGGNYHF